MKKYILPFTFRFLIFLFFSLQAFSEEDEYSRVKELLAGYMSNDLTLKKYTYIVTQSSLELEESKINNGVEVNLSSGAMTLKTNGSDSSFTVKPSATVSIPQLNNSSISFSATGTNEDDEDNWQDMSLTFETDIISGARLSRKIELLKSKRTLLESKRNLQDQALTVEKSFYSELKELYEYVIDVLEEKNDLYDNQLALRTIQAQGYSKSSSTYRSAELDVKSSERKVEKAIRELDRNTALFAKKCGTEYNYSYSPDVKELQVFSFLPEKIPLKEGLDMSSFPKDSYSDIEAARWATYIAELERKADYSVTLSGNAGYTFNDTDANSDTVDTGLSLTWAGLSLSAGISFPTADKKFASNIAASSSKDPIYSLSIGLKPNSFALEKIEDKQDEVNRNLELIDIKSAEEDYENDILDKKTSLEDIVWARKNYAEEYSMYKKLADDEYKYYKAGVLVESDYLDALTKRDEALVNALITDIEMIIYNNEVNLLFHDDNDEASAAHLGGE
ncbi:MAG: hypothetical protein K6F69_02240 [Treponema sp.]|nr:hypothetical protein [Treponema sp.]